MAGSIVRYFGRLDDPRQDQGKRHPLTSIIALTIIGVICGADEWTEVEDVARAKEDWLKLWLDLPHGIPSHDTLGRVFACLDPQAFADSLNSWIAHVAGLSRGELIAVDGKTLRRSHDASNGKAALHMVSAWCRANRVVLGQLGTELKEGEITAIPKLLQMLDLSGAVVTIDAIGCQKAIAGQIVDRGGDYLLQVKANQKSLHEDLKVFFEDARAHGFEDTAHAKHEQTDGGHGRVETRTCWSVWDIAWLTRHHDWPGLRSIVCVESQREAEGKTTTECRYYLSSLDGRDARQMLDLSRGHWSVENSLHWSLDISFGEDASRVRTDHAPANLAAIRRAVLSLLKQETSFKAGLKRKRKRCAMDPTYLRTVLETV